MPSFPILPLRQTLFRGRELHIHWEGSQQKITTAMQEKINRELFPGFNPFLVDPETKHMTLDWVKEKKGGRPHVWFSLSGSAVVIMIMIAGWIWWIMKKKQQSGSADFSAAAQPSTNSTEIKITEETKNEAAKVVATAAKAASKKK